VRGSATVILPTSGFVLQKYTQSNERRRRCAVRNRESKDSCKYAFKLDFKRNARGSVGGPKSQLARCSRSRFERSPVFGARSNRAKGGASAAPKSARAARNCGTKVEPKAFNFWCLFVCLASPGGSRTRLLEKRRKRYSRRSQIRRMLYYGNVESCRRVRLRFTGHHSIRKLANTQSTCSDFVQLAYANAYWALLNERSDVQISTRLSRPPHSGNAGNQR